MPPQDLVKGYSQTESTQQHQNSFALAPRATEETIRPKLSLMVLATQSMAYGTQESASPRIWKGQGTLKEKSKYAQRSRDKRGCGPKKHRAVASALACLATSDPGPRRWSLSLDSLRLVQLLLADASFGLTGLVDVYFSPSFPSSFYWGEIHIT